MRINAAARSHDKSRPPYVVALSPPPSSCHRVAETFRLQTHRRISARLPVSVSNWRKRQALFSTMGARGGAKIASMRNLLVKLSDVAIILAALPITASAAAGGVPLGPIVIPDRMGDAVYESVKDFEKTEPGAGQGARLQGSATRIDVFTYLSV